MGWGAQERGFEGWYRLRSGLVNRCTRGVDTLSVTDQRSSDSPPASARDGAPALGREKRRIPVGVNAVAAIAFLYLFLCAIKIMGAGLKAITHDPTAHERIHEFFAHTTNPFVALSAAVLVTSIVQSSSFTTSLIITLVGAGQLDIETGVFMVMGANIGTSVTSIIASLGSLRIKRQFQRAFAAAIVHDLFNLLSVAVLFPIEWILMVLMGRGPLAFVTSFLAGHLGLKTSGEGADPVKVICRPIVEATEWVVRSVGMGAEHGVSAVGGGAMAVLGVALLLVSLALMVTNLKGALLNRLEGMFKKVFFRNDAIAYVTGCLATVLVQSSSITTSLIVPLAGAKTVKLKRVFPYVLGANLGTTVTGLMAAAAMPVPSAVTVALAHTFFNIIGAAIWYPLRWVPINLAKRYAMLAAKKKRYALYYLFTVFIVVPGIGFVITEWVV